MIAAGLFATCLMVGFVVLDWWYFGRPEHQSMMYGCPIGSMAMELAAHSKDALAAKFSSTGVMPLPHGHALWFREGGRILLQADCRKFSSRFRTAWPLKGSIEVRPNDEGRLTLFCTKRTPWTSAAITLLWFLLVGGGSVGFVMSFGFAGGFTSMTGMMLGVGIVALGMLVIFFGLVTVAMAYRIENSRLLQVWQEWQDAMS